MNLQNFGCYLSFFWLKSFTNVYYILVILPSFSSLILIQVKFLFHLPKETPLAEQRNNYLSEQIYTACQAGEMNLS